MRSNRGKVFWEIWAASRAEQVARYCHLAFRPPHPHLPTMSYWALDLAYLNYCAWFRWPTWTLESKSRGLPAGWTSIIGSLLAQLHSLCWHWLCSPSNLILLRCPSSCCRGFWVVWGLLISQPSSPESSHWPTWAPCGKWWAHLDFKSAPQLALRRAQRPYPSSRFQSVHLGSPCLSVHFWANTQKPSTETHPQKIGRSCCPWHSLLCRSVESGHRVYHLPHQSSNQSVSIQASFNLSLALILPLPYYCF